MSKFKISAKVLGLLFVLLSIQNLVLAQIPAQQEIRRIIVTNKYEINEGKRSSKNMAIKQEIYDSLGTLFTVLNRDYETQEILNYTWYFHNNQQIFRTYQYDKEGMVKYSQYSYIKDSLIDTETIYNVSPTDTVLFLKLKYYYKKSHNPIKIDAFDIKGKRVLRTKLNYDINGTEIKRVVETKNSFQPIDSIVNLNRTVEYDSLKRITKETINEKYFNGEEKTVTYRYTYNPKGLIASIEEYNNNSLKHTQKFEYNSKGMLKFISVYDPNNVLIEYYAKRYELYPTRDRRNKIIEY